MQPSASTLATHFVYLLRCANGTIYVGQTHDLAARHERYRFGIGAHHVANIKPLEINYHEGTLSLADAVAR